MIRQESRHDVFTALGFAPAEAENLRIRSAMMRALVAFIGNEKLTQARAAKRLGVKLGRLIRLRELQTQIAPGTDQPHDPREAQHGQGSKLSTCGPYATPHETKERL